MATSNGMVKIHRAIMAERLGRLLDADELVHHKNEDKFDWSPENLELVTITEHADLHAVREGEERLCGFCQKPVHVYKSHTKYKVSFCNATCQQQGQVQIQPRTTWPTDEDLRHLVWTKPVSAIGKDLGVSGTAVRKRCLKLGIDVPGKGYWSKKRS